MRRVAKSAEQLHFVWEKKGASFLGLYGWVQWTVLKLIARPILRHCLMLFEHPPLRQRRNEPGYFGPAWMKGFITRVRFVGSCLATPLRVKVGYRMLHRSRTQEPTARAENETCTPRPCSSWMPRIDRVVSPFSGSQWSQHDRTISQAAWLPWGSWGFLKRSPKLLAASRDFKGCKKKALESLGYSSSALHFSRFKSVKTAWPVPWAAGTTGRHDVQILSCCPRSNLFSFWFYKHTHTLYIIYIYIDRYVCIYMQYMYIYIYVCIYIYIYIYRYLCVCLEGTLWTLTCQKKESTAVNL